MSCVDGALAWTAHDTFKQSSLYPGYYTVYDDDGDLAANGTFDFAMFWRATDVAVTPSGLLSSGTLTIKNQFGSATSESFAC